MRICRVIWSQSQFHGHFRSRNDLKNDHIQCCSARKPRQVARPFWSHLKDAFFYCLFLAEERFLSGNSTAIARKKKLNTRTLLVRFYHVGQFPIPYWMPMDSSARQRCAIRHFEKRPKRQLCDRCDGRRSSEVPDCSCVREEAKTAFETTQRITSETFCRREHGRSGLCRRYHERGTRDRGRDNRDQRLHASCARRHSPGFRR